MIIMTNKSRVFFSLGGLWKSRYENCQDELLIINNYYWVIIINNLWLCLDKTMWAFLPYEYIDYNTSRNCVWIVTVFICSSCKHTDSTESGVKSFIIEVPWGDMGTQRKKAYLTLPESTVQMEAGIWWEDVKSRLMPTMYSLCTGHGKRFSLIVKSFHLHKQHAVSLNSHKSLDTKLYVSCLFWTVQNKRFHASDFQEK